MEVFFSADTCADCPTRQTCQERLNAVGNDWYDMYEEGGGADLTFKALQHVEETIAAVDEDNPALPALRESVVRMTQSILEQMDDIATREPACRNAGILDEGGRTNR